MLPVDCTDLYSDGRHYDLQTGDFVADIPFYLKHIGKYGQPVLELACGTGRITIPLAERGIRITGLDVSKPMLAHAKTKARDKGIEIEWIHADCRRFSLSQKFGVIFIPFNSIAHLCDLESLQTCLARVHEHLSKGGRFIIDIFNPRMDILMRDPNRRYPVVEYSDPDGGGKVVITENNIYDAASQINRIKWYYRVGDGEVERVVENNMRILFPQELDTLLGYNGFDIEAKYGDYDETPFESHSPKQLIVCRARKG